MPTIWRFGVLAMFTVTLLLGANAAYASDSATRIETPANQTLTVNYTQQSSVDAPYAREYLNNETIVDSGEVTLSEGDDYRWNTSVGNVTWLNSAETTVGENVTIDYAYRRPTTGTRLSGGILQIFGGLVGILLLVVGVGTMYNMSGGGGGL